MFLTGIWNPDQLLSTIMFGVVSIVLFFALGRIVQQRLKVFKSTYIISIPLGFVTYMLINFSMFLLFTMFNLTMLTIKWTDIVKDIILFTIVLLLYKNWFPIKELKQINILSATTSIAALAGVFTIFFLVNEYYSWFNQITGLEDTYITVMKLSHNNAIIDFSYSSNLIINSLTKNQTYFIYWANISNINGIPVSNIFEYLIPAYVIIIIFCSFEFTFSNSFHSNKHILPRSIGSLGLTLLVLVLLKTFNSTSGLYIGFPIMLFGFSILQKDSNKYVSNTNNIVVSIAVFFTLFTMHESSIFMLLAIFIVMGIYVIYRRENSIFTYNILFISYWVIITLFTYRINSLFLVISFLVLILFFIPTWSLLGNSRRKDLLSLEEKFETNTNTIIILASMVSLLFITIISIFFTEDIGQTFIDYFTKAINISSKSWLKIFIWGVILSAFVLPTLIIWTLNHFVYKKRNEFISVLIILMLLFFNPISLTLWSQIFNVYIPPLLMITPFFISTPSLIYETLTRKNN